MNRDPTKRECSLNQNQCWRYARVYPRVAESNEQPSERRCFSPPRSSSIPSSTVCKYRCYRWRLRRLGQLLSFRDAENTFNSWTSAKRPRFNVAEHGQATVGNIARWPRGGRNTTVIQVKAHCLNEDLKDAGNVTVHLLEVSPSRRN